ncbi:histone-lysine N-methyltransferase SETMAR-like [Camponotus floridanus]|uniref:histone-lysine N-methyltransferase SETMAR-like n=1 Tax=Camponotus floridanus TaxID=104421 RepID=UPI000DC6C191|nr:histone-lysine N-methyltransferase SETMAR-like [Camponotus floridanus]
MNIENAPRSGRPVTTDVDQITALIDSERQITVREIAARLNIGKSTVSEHLNKLQMVKKLDVWVPHDLTEKNRIDRISISDLLYKRNEYDSFLKRIITGDEKWIIYNNVERKRSWSKRGEPPLTTSKAGLHPKKVMLCIWWNWKGIVYYELLPDNETIDSDKYCSQLDKLKIEIAKKCPELINRKGVVFHHDNARPHASLQTRQKLLAFGWDVLPHPPYSPDIAPSDFHLFRSLQNSINGLNFASLQLLKNYLDSFFAEKTQDFYERGIMKLPERWKSIVQNNGAYITE